MRMHVSAISIPIAVASCTLLLKACSSKPADFTVLQGKVSYASLPIVLSIGWPVRVNSSNVSVAALLGVHRHKPESAQAIISKQLGPQ